MLEFHPSFLVEAPVPCPPVQVVTRAAVRSPFARNKLMPACRFSSIVGVARRKNEPNKAGNGPFASPVDAARWWSGYEMEPTSEPMPASKIPKTVTRRPIDRSDAIGQRRRRSAIDSFWQGRPRTDFPGIGPWSTPEGRGLAAKSAPRPPTQERGVARQRPPRGAAGGAAGGAGR